MHLTLVIGSRNISSWSFRPWLALRQGGVPFDEVVVALRSPGTAARVAEWSPSGKVPVIHVTITDEWPLAQAFVVIEAVSETAAPQ